MSQAEVDRTPDAKAAMDKEWKKLTDKGCWLEDKVREFPDVQREAQHQKRKMHIGRIFEICSQKGSELPEGHPDQKWKGRSVFQGNKVSDENDGHAIFAELGSSPASMEAAKIIDVFEVNQDTPNSRPTLGKHILRLSSPASKLVYGCHAIAGLRSGMA